MTWAEQVVAEMMALRATQKLRVAAGLIDAGKHETGKRLAECAVQELKRARLTLTDPPPVEPET